MVLPKQFLTIHEVSKKLDVPKPTLRFWERALDDVLMPDRTTGGRRRYGPEHVALIEEIKILKKAGLSLLEIKGRLGNGNSQGGKQGPKDEDVNSVESLADRVATVVRAEVLRFMKVKMNIQ